MPQHDPRANILKWTLQSSATEHEQHRIRMAEMKSKPAMVQEIQDQELPHIVRSKIVLSGLRSSEQERHWQVELSRHKHSLKEIDHLEDTSSPQNKKTRDNNNKSKNRNFSEKADAAPVHHHHHHATSSASENQNPFSLKRFKVAAEIETQNERIMTNLKNVRPTVATARQCNDDAETRRRARRHFQRYPTPVGPPTLPGYENQNLQQQNNTARSAGRSRQLPPLNNNNEDDKHLSLTSDRHNNNNNNNNNNNPKPLSYMEQREFRERAWDSTTRVLYAQSSKGKSQPLEYMTIPSPLRNGGGNEISDHANNNNHQNENSNNDNNPKQRQLLTSSARAGLGIQPNNSGRDDNSSSDDDSDEEEKHEKTDALSVNSNSRKSSPERKSPNKKQQQNQLKPKPPAKNSGMKKGPQRINFLAALKQNPLLTQRRSQLNKEARAELEDTEDADRRRDIEQDEDDHWAHLLELERENNPQVLEQEYYDTITKKRQLQEEEARKQRVAAAVVAAAAANDNNNNNKSPSPANKRGKQDKSQEVVYTKELLHKLDRLCDIEDDERMTVMKQEERHYREWKAEESAEGNDLNLNPHVRMTQNFVRNRAPAALVRKMVLLRAKRHARAISRAMQYRHSRDQVLCAAIEAVQNGILVSEDEVATRNRERRRLVEVSEYDERHDGVEGNEIKDRNELSKRQEMSKEEVIRRLVEQEKDRKIQVDLRRREEVARPTSKDVVDRALQARERSLLQQKQKKQQSEAQQQQQQKQQQQDDLDSARREQVSRPASRDVVDSALKTRFDQLSRQNSPASPDRHEQNHHHNNSQNIISNRDDEHNDHDPAKSMTFLTQHDHEHENNNNKKNNNEQDKNDELMMESARRQNVSRPASREAIDSALRRRESDLHSSQRNSPDQQRPDSTSSIPRDSRVDNNAKTTTSAGINDSPHKISNNNHNGENKVVGVGAPAISPSPRVVTSRGKQEQNPQQHSDRDDSVSFSGSENELDSARRDRLSRPTSRDVVDSALRKRESDLSPRSSAVQQQQQNNNNTNRPITFSAGTGGTTDEEELPEF